MKIVNAILVIIRNTVCTLIILCLLTSAMFVAYKGSQPMQVSSASQSISYWQFIADRIEAAKTVQPSRCGWGMFLSLGLLGPVYSVVYTAVAVNPESFLARVTAPDRLIPKDVAGAEWYKVPFIWWDVVERLSWKMLADQHPGCNMRRVEIGD
ncbi:MAG: hypothetical protein CVU39_07430 [Chloroflexi bacterium HGW-Chloroflexi-10]|nr:MAG: hypothetical protein CVU39_07430 [Chloroflexi bacterium HGW-Chloroflexi-10]